MERVASLIDVTDPAPQTRWALLPGRASTFRLTIRNVTAEAHDVEVCIDHPAGWGYSEPHRTTLDPGAQAPVSVTFLVPLYAPISAGEYRAVLAVRDLDGIGLGEFVKSIDVSEHHELSLTVAVHGPRITHGFADGFVLRCVVINRGNTDDVVTASADPHSALTFARRTVQVPFQGEVSFNLEAQFAGLNASHPDSVTVRVPYLGGEAAATIGWKEIAAVVEPHLPPPLPVEEEEDPLTLSWLPKKEANDESSSIAGQSDSKEAPQPPSVLQLAPTTESPAAVPPTPTSAQPPSPQAPSSSRPSSGQPVRYTFGRRINPWWPLVEKFGGRWRIKLRPILLFVLVLETSLIMWQVAHIHTLSSQRRSAIAALSSHRGTAPTPRLANMEAQFIDPGTLVVSFERQDVERVTVTATSNEKTVARVDPVRGAIAIMRMKQRPKQPLVVHLTGRTGNYVINKKLVLSQLGTSTD